MVRYASAGMAIIFALTLSACASKPRKVETQPPVSVVESQAKGGGYLAGDGPGPNAPADIDAIPDAVPRDEPLHPYANREYVALGKTYTPLTVAGNYKEQGVASWYGKKFHGQRTSSGETYDMYAMTAAHPTLPIPSYARVTNLTNHKSVVVRINDRGPFLHDRIIDLSYTAAYKLGLIADGSGKVEVDSIATGSNIAAPPPVPEPISTTQLPPVLPSTVAKVAEATASLVVPSAEAVPIDVNSPATLPADGRIYLQLGAFRVRQGAEDFLAKMRAQLGDTGKKLGLFEQGGLVRVHIGPYTSKDEATAVAEKLQGALGFRPLVREH